MNGNANWDRSTVDLWDNINANVWYPDQSYDEFEKESSAWFWSNRGGYGTGYLKSNPSNRVESNVKDHQMYKVNGLSQYNNPVHDSKNTMRFHGADVGYTRGNTYLSMENKMYTNLGTPFGQSYNQDIPCCEIPAAHLFQYENNYYRPKRIWGEK